MIIELENLIEIKPLTQYTNINDHILISLDERKIISVQIYNPTMDKKYAELMLRYKKLYSVVLNGVILEIITHPTKNSLSTKTITHKLLYFNTTDLLNDYNKLKEIIKKSFI